jgi:flagellar biosynthetic protein FlhB
VPPADGEERTEQPTQRRLDEGRRRGQVAQSRELNTALVLAAGVALLYATGPSLAGGLRDLVAETLGTVAAVTRPGFSPVDSLLAAGDRALGMALPFLAGLLLLGGLAPFIQTGGVLSIEKLQPKFDRLNPLSGLRRLFGLRGLLNLGTTLVKLSVIATAVTVVLALRADEIAGLVGAAPAEGAGTAWSLALQVAAAAALGMLVVALADLGYQRWQHNRDMMMTKSELKEDLKNTEGDPQVKARVRAIQKQKAMRRMVQEVPKADVVVTNPTHLAVALKYDGGKMPAPCVTAKGADWLAQRIVSTARRHGVPIVQRKPLARMLYRNCEVGDAVPAGLFFAVAEVLAYVYRLRGRTA